MKVAVPPFLRMADFIRFKDSDGVVVCLNFEVVVRNSGYVGLSSEVRESIHP